MPITVDLLTTGAIFVAGCFVLTTISVIFSFKLKAKSREIQARDETIAAHELRLAEAHRETSELRTQYFAAVEDRHASERTLATVTARAEHLAEKVKQDAAMHGNQIETLRQEFQNLASSILERSTEKLEIQSRRNLSVLLDPLATRLKQFEDKVQNAYESESRERFALKAELEKIILANQRISDDATNLTRALKGDSKVQGNWGEMKLSMILEQSGLAEGDEYVREGRDLALKNEDGGHLRPDVIINLPDNKHIVIDSKVSLTAYERFINGEPGPERDLDLKDFFKSVRTHVEQLSAKHYQGTKGVNSPDFVLLFFPLEPAFTELMRASRDILTFAWDKRVMIVTPTTLLASLCTIASVWKTEKRNANALEIARQGGALYDKFAAFVEDLEKVGKSIDDTQKVYLGTMKKLKEGRGNLMSRTEKLRELGAKATKRLALEEEPSA